MFIMFKILYGQSPLRITEKRLLNIPLKEFGTNDDDDSNMKNFTADKHFMVKITSIYRMEPINLW